MTSTMESFTMGHTIVLSRGLVDVLPDEASLTHELGHVVLKGITHRQKFLAHYL
jgi:Zn-dependent protease with chaperone function